MPGSRRDQRFTLRVPWEGALRVPTDVTIERYSENEVWVVAQRLHPQRVFDAQCFWVRPPVTMNVRVAESIPVIIDGVVRHRLRLAVLD